MSEDKPSDKGLIIFGRDVSKIPCFRNSFLYGTLGGLAFGLAHFMYTSKVARSANYSVYAFSMITIGYWTNCRYNYSKAKFEVMRLQEKLQEHVLLEGTERDTSKEPPPPVEIIDI